MSPRLRNLFEIELQASAAGFPGAQDDLVTYTQIDLVIENPRYEPLMIKILTGKKTHENNLYSNGLN